MHGSRAGHTALCKNDLQPCQRSLPLPLYYTQLTRRGLQHAHARTHAHTQRKRERETDSIISLELLIEFCVKYDCVTFTIMGYKRCSLFMLLGFHLFFHPGRFLRIFWAVRVRRCILTEPGVSGGRIWRSALDLTLSQTPLQKSDSIQYCCWKRMSKKNQSIGFVSQAWRTVWRGNSLKSFQDVVRHFSRKLRHITFPACGWHQRPHPPVVPARFPD